MEERKIKAVAIAAALLVSADIHAENEPVDIHASSKSETSDSDIAAVPFMFSTDSMGLSAGVAGVVKKAGQPQASLLGAGLMTDKGTWMTYLGAYNYALSPDSRWLFGAEFYSGDYKDFNYYVGKAAQNNSHADEMIIADAQEALHQLSARYILPIGQAKHDPIKAALYPSRKLTGHTPWESGVSSIDLRPFYQARKFAHNTQLPPSDFATNDSVWGLETRFEWNNQDLSANPTQGSKTQIKLTYAPDTSDQTSWWKWELNQSWYWDLGKWDNLFDQQVFAFNVYTADTPSWNNTDSEHGYHRPPEYAGVKLGGLYRLRSYQTGRFVGRSAISYSAEYRVMPEWQPLGDWPVFNWYDVPWWQWVAFADVGRVADSYNVSELHSDMKWSAGGAVRFQVEGVVVRTEMAWGNEESIFRVMVNQPF
ncbi:BamA/TamA family outer membrane protein [Photobacterium leiognathi]|uniref:BamA/TamA family outer membrane protein n=1 Tax=Photobacterium leiognathi TaxID=553611 RepID=UPI00298123E3|nr:BamA/TamA family outer membrane protein [Photobacterium leiognathi]